MKYIYKNYCYDTVTYNKTIETKKYSRDMVKTMANELNEKLEPYKIALELAEIKSEDLILDEFRKYNEIIDSLPNEILQLENDLMQEFIKIGYERSTSVNHEIVRFFLNKNIGNVPKLISMYDGLYEEYKKKKLDFPC